MDEVNSSVYQKKYTIQVGDVDFTRELKMGTLFEYFQDIASLAVDALGIGIERLEKVFGVAWILMRVRVEIIRNPSYNEEITIDTWPQLPKRYEFERDYLVKDAEGNVIIKAVSTWVIFHIETRELRKTELIAIDYPPVDRERACVCKPGRPKPFAEPTYAYQKVIGYSDVDFNGHLNNSKYIDFMMDCFSIENHRKYGLKMLDVTYLNEVMPGDTLVLLRDISAVDANMLFIEGQDSKDGKAIFKAFAEIEPK